MALAALYNGLMKRTSTFALTMMAGAFAFERGFDLTTNYIWDSHNKGKLWKDIEHKFREE